MGDERLREIGRELRRLRVAAGLSGSGLAVRAGVPQPTVSRVETGRRVADPGVVVRLFEALELGPAEGGRLAALVRVAYEETAPRRVDAGVSFRPGAGVELELAAGEVRSFESAVMPGLLRTEGYRAAAGVLSAGDEVDRAAVLGDAGRSLVFVVTEGALRTWPGSGECMPGQLDRLVEVSGWGHVRLGVVPASMAVSSERLGVPLHGFTLYDQAAVTVETFTRELTLTDESDVRVYVEVFEGFARSAVFGNEAREILVRVREDYVKLLSSIH